MSAVATKQRRLVEVETTSRRSNFIMPKIRTGVFVDWFIAEGAKKCTALVTNVAEDTVGLLVFVDGQPIPTPRGGVRHYTDPMVKVLESNDCWDGMWDYSGELKREVGDDLREANEELAIRVNTLEARVDTLERQLEEMLTKPAA
jgi:hypothetical protein